MSRHQELGRQLAAVEQRAGGEIRRVRTRRATRSAADRGLSWLAWIPAGVCVLQLLRFLAGGEALPLGAALVFSAAALGVGLYVLFAHLRERSKSVDRGAALALADERLGLADRLQAADEFLGLATPTPFMEAALDDAEERAIRAAGNSIELEVPRGGVGRRALVCGLAGLALALVAARMGAWTRAVSGTGEDIELAEVDSFDPVVNAISEEAAPERENPELVVDEPLVKEKGAERREPTAETHERSAEVSEDMKESEGETGSGRSADAQSASGASQSRGAPSGQAQSTQVPDKKPKKGEEKPKKKPPGDPANKPKKRNEEVSGTTAGKGSSKGSNKNPAASSWSSKDQVTTQDDQEIEDDEDTEDEEEEQEARGGVQPAMRDRKPPVSRDLQIGFGNQPNPDANGRGGPSQHKKSRGTASLVLGVPIPDRVKGQPNPGKTKITQERIEPKAEESERLPAEARRPREAPVGHSAQPELVPWMRKMVRTYFLSTSIRRTIMTDQVDAPAEQARQSAEKFRGTYGAIRDQVMRMMVGQDEVVEGVLTALVAGGHVLLEGVPGLGKTILVRSLGEAVDLAFSRIQFTPDMMPADIQGTSVLVEKDDGSHELRFQEGPLVANLVLADEINRATPKTQSALLEAMQEHQITIGRKTIKLEDPYCVMATQNPVEQEGTYPLPEAQLDRFLMKLVVGYPKESEYGVILERTTGTAVIEIEPAAHGPDIMEMRAVVRAVPVPSHVQTYAVRLVMGTQPGSEYAPGIVNENVALGSSPRGAQALLLAGKVRALLAGRFAVAAEDVAALAPAVLRHRVMINFQGQSDGIDPDRVIAAVIDSVVPPHGEA